MIKLPKQLKRDNYSVELTDYKIKVESSATPHCRNIAIYFSSNEQSRIQIDLARRVGGTSTSQYVKVLDDYTIQGWMKCTPDGGDGEMVREIPITQFIIMHNLVNH